MPRTGCETNFPAYRHSPCWEAVVLPLNYARKTPENCRFSRFVLFFARDVHAEADACKNRPFFKVARSRDLCWLL